jgi:hypothetical protein
VEGGDVLDRDQDVPVQLDMDDVLDVAVRGEHALLVLPAEQGDLDLLALVLARVVLDASERSRIGSTKRAVPAVEIVECRAVWSGVISTDYEA